MRPRLIPVLTLDRRRRLVKTLGFGNRTYIGDPFNVLRLFNEKEVDEIVVLDIDATVDGRNPDPGFIGELASECFIPLAYGGGLSRMPDCEDLARLGVEKFVIGSAATDTRLLQDMARTFGSQSVAGCVDARGEGPSAMAFFRSGGKSTARTAIDLAKHMQANGCGEIIIQSIPRDGTRTGYDLALIEAMSRELDVPLIALGGAGECAHLEEALHAGASAAASASAFSFIGRLRAVLISYPGPAEIKAIGQRLPTPQS